MHRTPGHVAASLNKRFELFDSFDYREHTEWMSQYWWISVVFIAVYLCAIFAGQKFMRERKPFAFRGALTLWNSVLAIFSIMATARTLPELLAILQQSNGFHHSVCSSCDDVSKTSAFWAFLFVLSKVVELGDTAFIVLRKQPLIFLHWYHHCTVLLYSWYSYGDYISPARWFVVMNYLVHSFMYSYYALKACRVHIPRPIAISITLFQLSQMVVGIVVNSYAYWVKMNGEACDISYHHLHMGFLMYASYFVLFAHFFHQAYLRRRSTSATKTVIEDNNNVIASEVGVQTRSKSKKDD